MTVRRSGFPPFFIKILVLASVVFVSAEVKAQQEADYTVQANIIYRFTKYIDWPDDEKSGDFIIGVVGDSPIYDALNNFLAKKTVGKQKIVLRHFSASSNSIHCHILFISEDAGRSLKNIVAFTKGTSTLLVTEDNDQIGKGSCINFRTIDEHLRLEINKNNIIERDLNIAGELLSLAVIVK